MDGRIDPSPQRQGLRRTSQRLKMASTHLKIAPGKENVCPLDVLDSIAPLGQRRSPLPEDFPRIPLQDITLVLSPLNMQPEGELRGQSAVGKCGQRRKKARKESSTVNKSHQLQAKVTGWKGLTHCSTMEVSQKAQISNEAQSTEAQKEEILMATKASESKAEGSNSNIEEGNCSQTVRDQKRQRQSNITTKYPESKGRSSVLKLR